MKRSNIRALALLVAPEAACVNLQRLAADGLAGRFGLFEAIDYTPSRQRRGESSAVVRSFMAHHQGMSLLAFAYLLLGRPMQKRFESDPLLQATLLLLQERIPRATRSYLHTAEFSGTHARSNNRESPVRVFSSPNTPAPEVQLLSNDSGRIQWVVGAFYFNSEGKFDPFKIELGGPLAATLPFPFPVTLFDQFINTAQKTSSIAGFGETKVDLSDTTRMTIGSGTLSFRTPARSMSPAKVSPST